MSQKYDYSNYKPNTYELEKQKHKGNSSISFNLFHNRVVENKDKKSLTIYVDNFYEHEQMQYVFMRDEGFDNIEDYTKRCYGDILSDNPDYFEEQKEHIEEHREIISKFSKTFNICSEYYSKECKEALTCALAGAEIEVPLGLGLLDFCYAPFKEAFENSKKSFFLFSEEFLEKFRENMNISKNIKPISIDNKDVQLIIEYDRYNDAFCVLGNIINTSLYSLINPPALLAQDSKAYTRYTNYILDLQEEIQNLIKFCYDLDFYPKLFQHKTPTQRFNIYTHKSNIFRREEIFSLETLFSGGILPDIPARELIPYDLPDFDEDSLQNLSKEFNLDYEDVKSSLIFNNFSNLYYNCSTIYDALMLEFTKMLEHNILFRKCKNCGKYFILKGNYQNDFCDQIPDGQTKSCQTIGSLQNYKNKVKTSSAWNLYNKYYKRYFARMKAGNIDVDVFKKWQYTATAMRDDCNAGNVSEEDFEDFLFKSFVNKKR